MNRTKAQILRSKVETALKELAEAEGLTITTGKGRFGSDKFNLEVILTEPNSNGQAQTAEASDYVAYSSRWGLPKDGVGKTTVINGTMYKILGAKPRNYRYPIIVEDLYGKRWKMPASSVKRGLK